MKRFHADVIAEHAEGGLVLYTQAAALLQLEVAHSTALRRQIEALTLERDQLRAALRVADALRNRERGLDDRPLERRRWRRS